MRKELTWISPLRVGIIDAAIIAVVYLAIGILGLIFGGMMGGLGGGMEGAGMMAGGGIISFLVGVIFVAIMGFIMGVIGAFVYNVAAGIVGGIVIELKDA